MNNLLLCEKKMDEAISLNDQMKIHRIQGLT